MSNIKFFVALCISLMTIKGVQNLEAALCENYSSTSKIDNYALCANVKEKKSNFLACALKNTGKCTSICSQYNNFEEDCVAHPACKWVPNELTNSCRQKENGFEPGL